MSPLEQLTQKIIKAVPSIDAGCEEVYRNIGLEDVLIALEKNEPIFFQAFDLYIGGDVLYIDTKDNKISIHWLLNTPLHLQSEETIREINKLIK